MTPDPVASAPQPESAPSAPASSPEDCATDAVSVVAAGSGAASSHPSHQPVHTHCQNCGTELRGPYCHACGQHDFDPNRSFGHTVLEALENFFHFDAKFFRNIVTLLFRPGVLSAEFNAGKRASQMPPFRLYVFTAFVFFLTTFSRQDESSAIAIDMGSALRTSPAAGAPRDVSPESGAVAAAQSAQPPAALTHSGERTGQEKAGALSRWAEKQAARATQPEFQREMSEVFLGAVPKLMLLCLPIFALYTRVLFRRSGQLYLQQLVVALHFHTFLFLWIMFREGWEFLLGLPSHSAGRIVTLAANAWLAVYPLLMLRRLFAENWVSTLWKTLVLALGYLVTLALVFFLSLLGLIAFV